jgi:hypothetical protein
MLTGDGTAVNRGQPRPVPQGRPRPEERKRGRQFPESTWVLAVGVFEARLFRVDDRDQGGALLRLHTPADYRDAASDPDADVEMLCELARCPYPFVWQALASRPGAPAGVLRELCSKRDSVWNDNRLLRLIAEHPNADREILLKVLAELEVRLQTSVSRPYAAVLALAARRELELEEVQRLAALPGASARMRAGLRRRLAERPSAGE